MFFQCPAVFCRFMPRLDFIVNGVKIAQAINVPLLKIHSVFLLSGLFSFKGKLPIVHAFIIGIPCKPLIGKTALFCHQIDLGHSLVYLFVAVFVHICGFHDDFRTVLFQQRKKQLKLSRIIGSGYCGKRPVHQVVRHIGLQESFRNKYNSCHRISHKMYRGAGRNAHRLSDRGEPDVFGALLVRIIIFVFYGYIKAYLKSSDQPVYSTDRYQDTRRFGIELYCPMPVLLIETGYSLQGTAFFQQLPCQLTAQIKRRGTFVPQLVNLLLGKAPDRS